MGKITMAALALVGALASRGAVIAADDQKLSMTIYNSDLALVQDVRQLDLKAGRQKVEFKGVSAAIRPETVALSAKGVSIVEQNFDYDLLTPAKMMEKAVGQDVRIVRINPGNGQETTETATVLSVNEGVVLKIGDRIEVLRDDGIPTRVIFDKVPDNLRAKPTLSVTVEAATAGPRETTLRYLTTGLSWKADYVALFDEKAGNLALQGWITLNNTAGVSFQDAETLLVAGNINLANPTQGDDSSDDAAPPRGVAQAGSEPDAHAQLADYYVYPLPERTTIAQNQTKQVGFLTAAGVSARKVYQYRAAGFQTLDDPAHAVVAIDFSNSAMTGLGAAMPAGTVRVYVRDADGEPKFVGEDRIDHAPQGSELTVKTGEAFDVTVQPTLVSQTKASKTRSRYAMSYLVRNARAQPVMVEIRQGGLQHDGKVLSESLKSRRLDAYSLAWDVPAPANGETTLTFEVETGW